MLNDKWASESKRGEVDSSRARGDLSLMGSDAKSSCWPLRQLNLAHTQTTRTHTHKHSAKSRLQALHENWPPPPMCLPWAPGRPYVLVCAAIPAQLATRVRASAPVCAPRSGQRPASSVQRITITQSAPSQSPQLILASVSLSLSIQVSSLGASVLVASAAAGPPEASGLYERANANKLLNHKRRPVRFDL